MNKVNFNCCLWVVLVFSWLKTLSSFCYSFFHAFEGFHFLANIKRLLIWCANITEHRRFIKRCADCCFIKKVAFIVTKYSFWRTINFRWGFKSRFFKTFFRRKVIFKKRIWIKILFRFMLLRRHSSYQIIDFLFIEFHR